MNLESWTHHQAINFLRGVSHAPFRSWKTLNSDQLPKYMETRTRYGVMLLGSISLGSTSGASASPSVK